MKGKWISYTDAELSWIKACCDLPRTEAHALFVEIFKRPDVSMTNFNALCKRNGWFTGRSGQFVKGEKRADNPARKGYAPPGCEKGWFKPGVRRGRANAIYQPVGAERTSREGYLERKINDAMPFNRRWRAVHLIEWEAVHGPLPEGHILKNLSGDRTNTAPSNYEAIPRALLPRLNGRFGRGYDAAPEEVKPTILAIAKLEHRAREARKART